MRAVDGAAPSTMLAPKKEWIFPWPWLKPCTWFIPAPFVPDRAFRQSRGLQADGLIGPLTRTALCDPFARKVYTVQAGDTLSSIARQTGTPKDLLIRINLISQPDLIHPGQILWLP